MDKFVWHSVGEDNIGVTGMSVFLGEEHGKYSSACLYPESFERTNVAK